MQLHEINNVLIQTKKQGMKEGYKMTAGRTTHAGSVQWCTPKKYANLINIFFDYNIDLDPCSNIDSIIEAKNKFIYPLANGLIEDWNFTNIYVNPPYGRFKETNTTIKDWFKKCYEAHKNYNSEVIALVPVATNTSHWKEYVYNKANSICFLYDTRLKFRINGTEDNKGCPMACCIIYWGKKQEKFNRIFNECGYCLNIS